MTKRRRITTLLATGAVALSAATGCQDFLDVNTNPNAPTSVSANLYLPPMLYWMATSPMWDGRFIGRYTQQFMTPIASTVPTTWDRMGYDAGSDNGGQIWRDVYWSIGQNLVDMMDKAEAEKRWDLLGVGQVVKAWGWLNTTAVHGELIIKQAFDPTRFSFDYDSQEYAYQEVQRLLREAITNLDKTGDAVSQPYLARGDRIYGGDRIKWRRLAYGMLAQQANHFSTKSTYNPAQIIAWVDSSFVSNADDALLQYTGTSADNVDFNFAGRTRNNYSGFRQTVFVVNLMNGTHTGGTVDPRMSRMLAPSADGQYRGIDPNVPNSALALGTNAQQSPFNFHGYAGTGGAQLPGRYIFADRARLPVLTYSQLQFIKAEAALRAGQRDVALAAYRNGVVAHFDFVNARNRDDNQSPTQISAAERDAYLASPAVIPTAANLTLSHIMTQKYIAQWGWGHVELWTDMRRYQYTGTDPQTGRQIYPGFSLPTNLFPDNNGKPAYRIRPRFNSEYVWNRAGLQPIGGLDTDFHTKLPWIFQP
jgi:hypothetical protein